MPLPIPGEELHRMQSQLSPHYGSEVWEQDGKRVLVIRTPDLDPDVVNDLEAAIEYLSPADVKDLQSCLLVGESRTTAVSVAPLQELMEQRLQQDKKIAALLRSQIPGRQGHLLYRAPDDPKRIGRLGIRISHAHARDIDDEDLDIIADELGPQLESPQFSNVRAVYILADQDDVRLEADLFFQELANRFQDESRREQAEVEARRLAEEAAAQKKAEREEIMRVLRDRYPSKQEPWPETRTERERVSTFSPRSEVSATTSARVDNLSGREDTYTSRTERTSSTTASNSSSSGSSSASSIGAELDARFGRSRGTYEEAPSAPIATPAPTSSYEEVSAPAPSAVRAQARGVLEAAGYDVMENPDVPGHTVHLAGEREDLHPTRVIMRFEERFTNRVAQETLESARALETDLVVVVSEDADDAAKERIIATKVKWVAPDDLLGLNL